MKKKNTLTKSEIKLLDERWRDYKKNPTEIYSWSEVKSELKKNILKRQSLKNNLN